MFSGRYANEDAFNILNRRNVGNTPIREYNCAGYALGTYSWYCPDEENEKHGWDWNIKGRKRKYLKTAIEKMLCEFPNLRRIKSVKDCGVNEYVIAFRLADDDFHYMKRGQNGVWYEKCGNGSIHRVPQTDVFVRTWHGRYKGKIVLFAMKVTNCLQIEG